MKISKKATTIAVINQKGGTGKTTTCENLGVGLAMEGKKFCLWTLTHRVRLLSVWAGKTRMHCPLHSLLLCRKP